MSEPSVSIVIAAWPDTAGLSDCLDALAGQRAEAHEVFVVTAKAPPFELVGRFDWVEWLVVGQDCLIPHLWGLGMSRATGDVVAISTTQFAPASGWLEALRSAHARLEAPAIGGPIGPPRGGRWVDWASYFLRYNTLLKYDHEQVADELSGDNASYRRSDLESHPEVLRDGFWELEFHRRLQAEGRKLMYVPAVRVVQRASFGFRDFLRQRFDHGTQFGRARMRGRALPARVLAATAAPLIPVVFLGKILWRVGRSGRDLGPFVASLPSLSCFLLAWSLGEVRGYLTAGQAQGPEVIRHGGIVT